MKNRKNYFQSGSYIYILNYLNDKVMDKIENLISITEVPAGPYIVKGEFKIITKDGKENILTGTNALCRCGHSKNKPFCDGTHRKINFEKGDE